MQRGSYLLTALIAMVPQVEGSIARHVDGHDWTLPNYVSPSPGSGLSMVDEKWIERWEKLYPMDSSNPNALQYTLGIEFTWAGVNPGPGVYHWEELDKLVARTISTPHLGFALCPGIFGRKARAEIVVNRDLIGDPSGQYPMIPEFVNVQYLQNGAAAGWAKNSDYLSHLSAFLGAIAKRYKDHPRFNYIRAGIMDYAFGEGKLRGLNDEVFQEAVAQTGLNPESYKAYLKAITDVFCEAFPGQEKRVVWTNWDDNEPLMHYDPLFREGKIAGWQYALQKGLGGRDGQVEDWMRYLSPGYGNVIDADGYLIMNHNYAPIREQRIWYTENENMGSRFGPKEFIPYHYFASTMRLIQMHRNWYWIPFKEYKGHETAFTYHPLTRYSQLSLGKRVDDSPDAWCWLRQGWGNSWGRGMMGDEEFVVKNMERWLQQRDRVPDGRTQAAMRLELPQKAYNAQGRDYEYIARRTDQASGQHSIYFKIDADWYKKYSDTTQVFVTYQDTNESTWCVELTGAEKGKVQTPAITTGNSGLLKTVVFSLPALRREGLFSGHMDFRIMQVSGGDAVIQLVRLVKVKSP